MMPVQTSWPTRRPPWAVVGAAACRPAVAEEAAALSHAQLQAWMSALHVDEHGHLAITADSLASLDHHGHLSYDLLGPLLLAAVHSLMAAATSTCTDVGGARDDHEAAAAMQHPQPCACLCLQDIDVQEPLAQPLRTCVGAYACLQHLCLRDCNIDAAAAAVLATLCCSTSCGDSCSSSGVHLTQLSLDGVFMCELAWRGFTQGLAAGCALTQLSLRACLCDASTALLAAALPAGCSSLRELDVSSNCGPACTSSREGSHAISDAAWAGLLQAVLAPTGCQQLAVLQASRCSLGPAAAAALCGALAASHGTTGLRRLQLAHCTGMGQHALQQLCGAAAACKQLEHLDLSHAGVTPACIAALAARPAAPAAAAGLSSWLRWPRHLGSSTGSSGCACGLQQLHLAGNSGITADSLVLLAQAAAPGAALGGLQLLDVAHCPAIGDAGAACVAAALSAGHAVVTSLDVSGCEIGDAGAAALMALQGMQELRLADNHITPAGMWRLADALGQRSCCSLALLDVSCNWAGPRAVQPLVTAAAAAAAAGPAANRAPRQPLRLLHECSHEMWRVQSAKAAAAAAAAAADAAAAAAVAAHVSGGSSCSAAAGQHQAGSTAACSHASGGGLLLNSRARSGAGSCGSLQTVDPWLLAGAGDEDADIDACCSAAASGCGGSSSRESCAERQEQLHGLTPAPPAVLPAALPAAGALALAPEASRASDGATSLTLSCIVQEASFRYQCHTEAAAGGGGDDVALSPTRCIDQQQLQQQQQGKAERCATPPQQLQQQLLLSPLQRTRGVLGSKEFDVSPVNPLFSATGTSSASTGSSPPEAAAATRGNRCASFTAAGAAVDNGASILAGAAGSTSAPGVLIVGSLWAGDASSSSSSSSSGSCAADDTSPGGRQQQTQELLPALAARRSLFSSGSSSCTAVAAGGSRAALALRRPPPTASLGIVPLTAASPRALPPGSPRRSRVMRQAGHTSQAGGSLRASALHASTPGGVCMAAGGSSLRASLSSGCVAAAVLAAGTASGGDGLQACQSLPALSLTGGPLPLSSGSSSSRRRRRVGQDQHGMVAPQQKSPSGWVGDVARSPAGHGGLARRGSTPLLSFSPTRQVKALSRSPSYVSSSGRGVAVGTGAAAAAAAAESDAGRQGLPAFEEAWLVGRDASACCALPMVAG